MLRVAGIPVTREFSFMLPPRVRSRIGFCGAIGSIFIFLNDFAVFGAPIHAERRKYQLRNRLRR